MGRLDGKVALVTGASSGIGRSIAELFAREGAKVVCASSSGRADETAKLIGDAAIAVRADVTLASDVERMVATAEEQWGRLDVLVNNAGYAGPKRLPLIEHTEENFDLCVAVNLKGVFLGMKYGIAALLRTGGGSVINVASATGVNGWEGNGCYGAAKAGAIHMTKTAALDYARDNIRVNVICPGAIWTPFVKGYTGDPVPPTDFRKTRQPNGRWALPEDVAPAALFLASDESEFVNGVVIPVDAGWTAGHFEDPRHRGEKIE
jgi:NAD(P)-dependent dehydrogenase (short-subunit alcohol dehydrogenase family)